LHPPPAAAKPLRAEPAAAKPSRVEPAAAKPLRAEPNASKSTRTNPPQTRAKLARAAKATQRHDAQMSDGDRSESTSPGASSDAHAANAQHSGASDGSEEVCKPYIYTSQLIFLRA
jgi:hypothetical protein